MQISLSNNNNNANINDNDENSSTRNGVTVVMGVVKEIPIRLLQKPKKILERNGFNNSLAPYTKPARSTKMKIFKCTNIFGEKKPANVLAMGKTKAKTAISTSKRTKKAFNMWLCKIILQNFSNPQHDLLQLKTNTINNNKNLLKHHYYNKATFDMSNICITNYHHHQNNRESEITNIEYIKSTNQQEHKLCFKLKIRHSLKTIRKKSDQTRIFKRTQQKQPMNAKRGIALKTFNKPLQAIRNTQTPKAETNISTTTTSILEPNKTQIITDFITDYASIHEESQEQETEFESHNCRVILIAVSITFGIACSSILIIVLNCYRVTTFERRSTVCLELPITLLPEDRTLLNSDLPEHSVPMLSVQTAGCAGMERLGVPTRTSLSTPSEDRGQFTCRMRVDAIQARELLAVRGDTVILNNSGNNVQSMNNTNHQQQQQQHNNQQQNQQQQHSHRNQYHQHQQQNSHLQQQQQQQQARQQQQHELQSHHKNHSQHYLRMTTPNNNSSSSSGGNQANKRSSSNNIVDGGASSSNIVRGGIEATTLKYGNTGSGNKAADSSSGSSTSFNHHHHQQQYNSSSGSSDYHQHHHPHYKNQLQQQQTLRCPYHVPLPPVADNEWGQLRTAYQQSEITRSYITPAPNKTIKDVPEQSPYSSHAMLSQQQQQQLHYNSPSPTPLTTQQQHLQQQQQQQQQQNKSKSVITKLFSRKSSPKSPTSSHSSLSTCSSLASSASLLSSASFLAPGGGGGVTSGFSSTSSSTSSLAGAPLSAMPISNATTLKTTPCSYGATTAATAGFTIVATNSSSSSILSAQTPACSTSNMQQQQHIMMSQAPNALATERIPTPPLAVLVPIPCLATQSPQAKLHEQQFDESSNSSRSSSTSDELPTTLQNGFNRTPSPPPPTSTLNLQPAVDNDDVEATSSRNNNHNILTCSCYSKNCDVCNAPAALLKPHNQ